MAKLPTHISFELVYNGQVLREDSYPQQCPGFRNNSTVVLKSEQILIGGSKKGNQIVDLKDEDDERRISSASEDHDDGPITT